MNKNNLVTVILPVYNDYLFLEEAINSILNQTYEDIELIICNDGSSNQQTLEILKKYENNQKVVIFHNDRNMGLPYSLNKCILTSKGDYIARMDGDDISKNNRIEEQMKYLTVHVDIAAVSSSAIVIDELGNQKGIILHPSLPSFKDVLERTQFVHPASLFRKEALIKSGLYSTDPIFVKGRCEDYDIWCRLYYNGYRCANIQESLLLYRELQSSFKKRKRQSYRYNLKAKLYWRKKGKKEKPSLKPVMQVLLQWILPSRVSYYLHKKRINKNGVLINNQKN